MAYRNDEKVRSVGALMTYIDAAAMALGDRLPGETALSRELGISRHLVRHALSYLDAEGLIERRGTSGTYLTRNGDVQQLRDEVRTRDGETPHRTIAVMDTNLRQPDISVGQRHAQKRGFLLHTYFAIEHGHRWTDEREYIEQIMANRFWGLLIHPTASAANDAFLRDVASRVCLAHINYHSTNLPEQSFFVPDYVEAAMLGAAHLTARGCRRLVLSVSLPSSHHVSALLCRGAERACRAVGVPPPHLLGPTVEGKPAYDDLLTCRNQADGDTGIIHYSPTMDLAGKRNGCPAREIAITDGLQQGSLALPSLQFDWGQRIRDALDWMMADRVQPAHRLYTPDYYEAGVTADNRTEFAKDMQKTSN